MNQRVKMHTTIYWEVPEDQDPELYMDFLKSSLTKWEALRVAISFSDGKFEVANESDN